MNLKNLASKLGFPKKHNAKNKVTDRCKGCRHLDKGYYACTKDGTCIYDLADIAVKES